ncbi:MAG: hypothetical protein LQ341_000579 [Variospora aurantia]|nr:MAG: hypothetical protein LQ341_000579 [Variospora aurantia]
MVPSPQDSPFDYIAYIRYFQAAAYPSVANDPRTISSLLVPSSKNTDQDDAHAIQADEDDISVQRLADAPSEASSDENCAICRDSLGPRSVATSSQLVKSALRCGHEFHEYCLLQWLTPIQIVPTEVPSSASHPAPRGGDTPDPAGLSSSAGLSQNRTTYETPDDLEDAVEFLAPLPGDHYASDNFLAQDLTDSLRAIFPAAPEEAETLDNPSSHYASSNSSGRDLLDSLVSLYPEMGADIETLDRPGGLSSASTDDVDQVSARVREVREISPQVHEDLHGEVDLEEPDMDEPPVHGLLQSEDDPQEVETDVGSLYAPSPEAYMTESRQARQARLANAAFAQQNLQEPEDVYIDDLPLDSEEPPEDDPVERADPDVSDPQYLPPIDQWDLTIYRDNSPTPRTHERHRAQHSQCPLCRQAAFDTALDCHSDTLQLLRVRLRLTDLAYGIFDFERQEFEDSERDAIKDFLRRRDNDAMVLREQLHPPPSDLEECRRVFTKAREQLREDAYDYLYVQRGQLSSAEHSHVIQLATVFENLRLKDAYIPFFFGGDPSIDLHEWNIEWTEEQLRDMFRDPETFFEDCEIVPDIEGRAAMDLEVGCVEDGEMGDVDDSVGDDDDDDDDDDMDDLDSFS